MKAFTIPGDPVGKPRQTQRDKWMQRPAVVRYRKWADLARILCGKIPAFPSRVRLVAFFTIPKSWKAEIRETAVGVPHRQKPDVDNIAKSLLDALFADDQGVHTLQVEKRWDDGRGARLEVEIE